MAVSSAHRSAEAKAAYLGLYWVEETVDMRGAWMASKMAALLDNQTAAQMAASMVRQMAAVSADGKDSKMVDVKVSSKEYHSVVYSAVCSAVL